MLAGQNRWGRRKAARLLGLRAHDRKVEDQQREVSRSDGDDRALTFVAKPDRALLTQGEKEGTPASVSMATLPRIHRWLQSHSLSDPAFTHARIANSYLAIRYASNILAANPTLVIAH